MKRLALLPALVLALSVLGNGGAVASGGAFDYHIGDAFLAGFGLPTPDMARADNGDSLTMVGTGTLNTNTNAVSGGGTFEHRNASGVLLVSGTWTATGLITFQSYGCDGAGLPSILCGGRAALTTALTGHPAGNPGVTLHAHGLLEVTCVLGSPPSGAAEGIRLNVKDILNFNKSVSGATVFVS